MTTEAAEELRDRFHAEGNRFGDMAEHHREECRFKLGPLAEYHRALAEKWALGQHLSYAAAGMVSDAAGIAEYGRAWDERLKPDGLEKKS